MSDVSEPTPATEAALTKSEHAPAAKQATTVDYTKRRWYIGVDFTLRALSTLAIAALGYAGWRLQQNTENARAAMVAHERAERKYLPELRSISEVDVALLETSKEFDWPTFTEAETTREARVGAHLTYLGSSLYFPDGEPTVDIISESDNITKVEHAATIKTTARRAVLFLAEFMRYAPLFRRWEVRKDARVVVRGQRLLIVGPSQTAPLYTDVVDPRTAELWQRWLPPGGATPMQLFRDVDLTILADDIDEQLLRLCDDIVKQHSDLAEKYVEIRSDVLKARSSLLE